MCDIRLCKLRGAVFTSGLLILMCGCSLCRPVSVSHQVQYRTENDRNPSALCNSEAFSVSIVVFITHDFRLVYLRPAQFAPALFSWVSSASILSGLSLCFCCHSGQEKNRRYSLSRHACEFGIWCVKKMKSMGTDLVTSEEGKACDRTTAAPRILHRRHVELVFVLHAKTFLR